VGQLCGEGHLIPPMHGIYWSIVKIWGLALLRQTCIQSQANVYLN